MELITHCVSTYNNLNYLKLVIRSVYKNATVRPFNFFVYAENCTDGTDEWLKNQTEFPIQYLIEKNSPERGIGGGMNKCAERATTEYINFLHSDFYVGKNFDKPLLDIVSAKEKITASSWRVEPDLWNQPSRMGCIIVPKEEFGLYHNTFNPEYFENWAEEFSQQNGNAIFRKAEGVSFMIRKKDWDFVGGCDPLFEPSGYEDMDLFVRMQCMGFDFVETPLSMVYHFGSRGGIFQQDNINKMCDRHIKAEKENPVKWMKKWGTKMITDQIGFVSINEEYKKKFNEIYK